MRFIPFQQVDHEATDLKYACRAELRPLNWMPASRSDRALDNVLPEEVH